MTTAHLVTLAESFLLQSLVPPTTITGAWLEFEPDEVWCVDLD